ncbi:hypothetical protein GTY23_20975 [Streptomyces sp. SID5998]|nr:hypothetical protein [Streptomyces sp. SID5998]
MHGRAGLGRRPSSRVSGLRRVTARTHETTPGARPPPPDCRAVDRVTAMRIRGARKARGTRGRGRSLRLAAVLAATVLALTGFSRGHGHSHSGHGGSGGGCSSSHQDHDSTTSSTSGGGSAYDHTDDTYGDADADDEDSYGTSSTSGGSSGSSSGGSSSRRPGYRSTPSASGTASGDLAAGKVRLVSCATQKAPYATVEVSNPNGTGARFTAFVEFRDAEDESVAYRSAEVTVPADGTARVRVPLDDGGVKDDGLIHEVDHCAPDPTAPPLDD